MYGDTNSYYSFIHKYRDFKHDVMYDFAAQR